MNISFDVEIAEWLAFKFSNFGIRCLSRPVVKPIMWISSMWYNQKYRDTHSNVVDHVPQTSKCGIGFNHISGNLLGMVYD
jgi:hypothetical protein